MTKRFIFYRVGCEYLVTIYDDNSAELATRQNRASSWGPPAALIYTDHDEEPAAQEATP